MGGIAEGELFRALVIDDNSRTMAPIISVSCLSLLSHHMLLWEPTAQSPATQPGRKVSATCFGATCDRRPCRMGAGVGRARNVSDSGLQRVAQVNNRADVTAFNMENVICAVVPLRAVRGSYKGAV